MNLTPILSNGRSLARTLMTAIIATATASSFQSAAAPAETPSISKNSPQPTSRSAQPAVIRRIERTVLPDVVRITIELDGEVPFHDERLDNPPRVFIDLRSTRTIAALTDKTLRFDGDAEPVHQIRVGRHPNSTTRVVLEAADVVAYSIYQLYRPHRLVIDCARRVTARTETRDVATRPAVPLGVTAAIIWPPPALRISSSMPEAPPPLFARRTADFWSRRAPGVAPLPPPIVDPVDAPAERASTAEAISREASGASTPPPAPEAPSTPRARLTIARQLGLGVSRIVIDPGHGGHDPGAQGNGVAEAELVLDIALRLEKLLAAIPGIEVVLTRRTDEFVALQERTAIANREGADLFLSIHANANSTALARGVETYFLNFASTLSAAAVAKRENAASGQAMAALPDLVKAIALNNKLDESREFATLVQRGLIDRLRPTNKTLRDLGVRQAPFVVLIGAAMPSVLTEISFVTNAQEAKLLKSSAYRQRIADALFNAIRKYQTSLNSAPKIAGTRD